MRHSVVAAYDVLLGRGGALPKIKQVLSEIESDLRLGSKHNSERVYEFVEVLSLLESSDQVNICSDIPPPFLYSIAREPTLVSHFLKIYEAFVESQS
ncbi:MAG TPA: hypothetical protein VIM00_13325, partial [Candidatus Acidoferrum sp.]